MGAGDFSYSINQGASSPINNFPTQINGLSGGEYTLAVIDENDCSSEMQIEVPSPENILLAYDETESINLGDSILLLPFPNFTPSTINWFPPIDLSCMDCLQPWASPTATTTYEVEMENDTGCRVMGRVVIEVDRPQVYIPNAFSPNDDGDNDIFFLQSNASEVNIKTFVIADRWGEIVFSGNNFKPNDPNFGWNGIHKGKKMNPAVFVFYAEIEYADGQIVPVKGDLTLLR